MSLCSCTLDTLLDKRSTHLKCRTIHPGIECSSTLQSRYIAGILWNKNCRCQCLSGSTFLCKSSMKVRKYKQSILWHTLYKSDL